MWSLLTLQFQGAWLLCSPQVALTYDVISKPVRYIDAEPKRSQSANAMFPPSNDPPDPPCHHPMVSIPPPFNNSISVMVDYSLAVYDRRTRLIKVRSKNMTWEWSNARGLLVPIVMKPRLGPPSRAAHEIRGNGEVEWHKGHA